MKSLERGVISKKKEAKVYVIEDNTISLTQTKVGDAVLGCTMLGVELWKSHAMTYDLANNICIASASITPKGFD